MTRPKLRGPGKPPVDLKHGRANDRPIRIRVSDEQRRLLEGAARHRQLRVSTWLRDLGLRAARGMGRTGDSASADLAPSPPLSSSADRWPTGEPVVYAVGEHRE